MYCSHDSRAEVFGNCIGQMRGQLRSGEKHCIQTLCKASGALLCSACSVCCTSWFPSPTPCFLSINKWHCFLSYNILCKHASPRVYQSIDKPCSKRWQSLVVHLLRKTIQACKLIPGESQRATRPMRSTRQMQVDRSNANVFPMFAKPFMTNRGPAQGQDMSPEAKQVSEGCKTQLRMGSCRGYFKYL